MAIFGKRLGSSRRGDLKERVTALEEHVRYMQEMLEYYARQTEKKLESVGESEKVSTHGRIVP